MPEVKTLIEGTRVELEPNDPRILAHYRDVTSASTLIRADGRILLVDTGAQWCGEELLAKLAEEGLRPSEVDFVISTHMHPDHVGNNFLFPDAVNLSGYAVFFPDRQILIYHSLHDLDMPEGVELIPTPGHTPDHISVVVQTNGQCLVIAGDAVRKDILLNQNRLYCRDPRYMESAGLLLRRADSIVPGHGPVLQGAEIEDLKATLNI